MVLNTGCVPIVGCVLRNKPSWPTILLFVLTLSDAIVVVFGLTVGVAAAVDNSLLWDIGPLCTCHQYMVPLLLCTGGGNIHGSLCCCVPSICL